MGLVALYGLERLVTRYRPGNGAGRGRRSWAAAALAFESAAPIPFFAQNPATALAAMMVLFFAAVLLGMPVSFAMLLGDADLSAGHGHRPLARRAAEHGRRHLELHSAGAAVLHLRRVDHGEGRDQRPADPLRDGAGRPAARRAAAGGRGHDLPGQRHLRLQGRRRRRGRRGDPRRAAQAGLQPERGRGRARRLGRHGRDDPAQHRHADPGFGHLGLDRHAVRRRAGAGGGDRALPDGADLPPVAAARTGAGPGRAAGRVAPRLGRRGAAAGDAGGDGDRHPVRHRHADGGVLLRRDLRHRALDPASIARRGSPTCSATPRAARRCRAWCCSSFRPPPPSPGC